MKLFTWLKEKVKRKEEHKENKIEKSKEVKEKKPKTKRTWKQRLFLCLKILVSFLILGMVFIILFFKTNLFQSYKELWVQTAMTTMSHQYLATWFLSEEEIQEIMDHLEVKNDENSDNSGVVVRKNEGDVTIEKITGTGYVGYVMIVPDASKVKLIDTRIEDRGLKLTEIVEKYNAIGAINAGGYVDPQGKGMGNILLDAVIMNRELLNGDREMSSSLIGLDKKGKLILGRYNYQQALDAGIESAIKFGPYLIVNGKNQIQNANSGRIASKNCDWSKTRWNYDISSH